MLDRAICDYLQTSAYTEKYHVREAGRWIFKNTPPTNKKSSKYWPFTFLEICQNLEFDPKVIRCFVAAEKAKSKPGLKRGDLTGSPQGKLKLVKPLATTSIE